MTEELENTYFTNNSFYFSKNQGEFTSFSKDEIINLLEVLWAIIFIKFNHLKSFSWFSYIYNIDKLYQINLFYSETDLYYILKQAFMQRENNDLENYTDVAVLVTHNKNQNYNILLKDICKDCTLILDIKTEEDSIILDVLSHANTWEPWLIREMVESYFFLLSNFKKYVNFSLEKISILSKKQQEWLLKWNGMSHITKEPSGTLVEFISKTYNLTPESIAIISTERCLTYREVEEKSNQIANALLSLNIKEKSLVALLGTASWESIIAILGILKIGATYLPINPHDTTYRINKIFKEAKPDILIHEKNINIDAFLEKLPTFCVTSLLQNHTQSQLDITPFSDETIAYVLYTSGSTGEPKGVAISHHSVLNTLIDTIKRFEIKSTDKILSLSSLGFDLSVFDIFSCLICGATVILLDEEDRKNPQAWADLIISNQITIWNSVPALMELFIHYLSTNKNKYKKNEFSLRLVLLSGDLISPRLPEKITKNINPSIKIFALGGSTEASIWSLGSYVTKWNRSDPLPYGQPLSNQSIYIVDENNLLLPPGALGEIVITGVGLAKYYLSQPLLTQERFPVVDSIGRIFKCRDLGRINLKTKMVEFYGRLDRQIKIRGHRIDSTEIEQALIKIDAIESAIVFTYEEKNKLTKLVAALKCTKYSQPISNIELTRHLKNYLSRTMLPSYYIWIEKWPLNENGKIDYSVFYKHLKMENEKDISSKLTINKDESLFYSYGHEECVNELQLTPNLIGMLYESKKISFNTTYTFAITISYSEHLNYYHYKNACQLLFEHYNVLRQIFNLENSSLTIHPSCNIPFHYFDWTNVDHKESQCWLETRHKHIMTEGFNPKTFPLILIEYFQLPKNETLVKLYFHHLLIDGISSTVLINHIHTIYNDIITKQDSALKTSKILLRENNDYTEFINWRNQQDISSTYNFWEEELSNITSSSLLLSCFRKNNAIHENKTTEIWLRFDEDEKIKIRKLCNKIDISLVTLLQGCWSLLIAFLLDQDTVISGLCYSGRGQIPEKWRSSIGLFINTLPLILEIPPESSFSEWLSYVKNRIQKTKEYDIIALSEINSINNSKVSEYFDTIFIAHNFSAPTSTRAIKIKNVWYDQTTHFPITVQFDKHNFEIKVIFSCALPFQYKNTIINTYHFLIRQAISEKINKIKDFVLADMDNASIIYGKKNYIKFDLIKSFFSIFEMSPNKIAYINDDIQLTYKDLYTQVQALIRKFKNLKINFRLAIILPRDHRFIITILACLQERITFIPIDINLSIDKIKNLMKNVNCHYIITIPNEELLDFNDEINILYYSKDPINFIVENTREEVLFAKNYTAYIFFTSGTTSLPKAIEISINALNNNLLSLKEELDFTANDSWLSVTQNTFDIVLLELLIPICCGGSVLVPTDIELVDIRKLNKLIAMHMPTFLQTTPSRWRFWLDFGLNMNFFKCLLTGGESLTNEIFYALAKTGKKIFNLYGPTETTIWETIAELNLNEAIHIGKPLANTFCLLRNQFGQILPLTVSGELCIGGNGLSSGYVNETQTLQSFTDIQLKKDSNTRIYKTGDRAWMDIKHRIYYLDRLDRQIKIRGQRINPAEIESAIKSIDSIKNAVVTFNEDTQELISFIQPYSTYSASMPFSIFCFPEGSIERNNSFEFYQSLAEKADKLSFYGMWIPERHFDAIGAQFSAPAVVAASLASKTENLVLGAGSIVAPLHHPANIVEQWATLDCLSKGRIRFSIASGWHADDFILAPDNFTNRKNILFEQIKQIKHGWEKGIYNGKNGLGEMCSASLYPRPLQKNCPLWIAIAEDIEVFKNAGLLGLNILTHLLMQNVEDLYEKITAYSEKLTVSHHELSHKNVTLMVHTYVHEEPGVAYERCYLKLVQYFKAHLTLLKKMEKNREERFSISDTYLEKYVENFILTKSLIGTPEECIDRIKNFKKAGVTEIACLIDFGLSEDTVLDGLQNISELASRTSVLSYPAHINTNDIRKELSKIISPTMTPNKYFTLDEIPMTTHNKIDFNALKMIAKNNMDNSKFYPYENIIHTQNDELTYRVLTCCKAVLNREEIYMELSFFEQGGHSLRALQLITELQKCFNVTVPLEFFLNDSTIKNLIEFIRNQKWFFDAGKNNDISTDYREKYPLLPMQTDIWVFNQLFPEASCYHDAFLYEVKLNISSSELANKISSVLSGDPIFGIVFFEENNAIFQKKSNLITEVKIIEYDRPIGDNIYHDLVFTTNLLSSVNEPFQLKKLPPIRIFLHNFPDRLYLELVLHHIITDGKSINNLISNLEKVMLNKKTKYNGIQNYFDYIDHVLSSPKSNETVTNNYVKQMRLRVFKTYWKHTHSLPEIRSFKGFKKNLHIKETEFLLIQKKALSLNTTISNILLTIFYKTIFNYINNDTLQIGVPISLRDGIWDNCFGLFINFGIISMSAEEISEHNIFELASKIKERTAFLVSNRKIHFRNILKEMNVGFSLDTHPLFQVVFNYFETEKENNGCFLHIPIDYKISRFDLELQVFSSKEDIDISFIFSDDIFSKVISDEIRECFKTTLTSIIYDNKSKSEPSLYSVSLKSEEKIIAYWNSIYNNLYKNILNLYENRWAGWNSIVDSRPFPEYVMCEWLEDTVEKINRYPLGDVLEIGCGSGCIMHGLKENLTSYLGIDFSSIIVEKLCNTYKYDNIEFIVLAAHEIDVLQPRKFDTIILNSVVQYFPSIEYLELIIEKCILLLKPKNGKIFLGDLYNLHWKDSFHNYIELLNTKKEILNYFQSIEQELFVGPEFYHYLSKKFPIFAGVIIEPKFMKTENELCNFRFDMTLSTVSVPNNYNSNVIDGEEIRSVVELFNIINNAKYQKTFPIIVKNIYNKRIASYGINPTDLYDIDNNISILVLLDPWNHQKIICHIDNFKTDIFLKMQNFKLIFDQILSSQPISYKTIRSSWDDFNLKDINIVGLEVELKKIWSELLNQKISSKNENFFDLGGDSMSYIQLFNRIKELGYKLKIKDLLSRQTLNEQITFLSSLTSNVDNIH